MVFAGLVDMNYSHNILNFQWMKVRLDVIEEIS